MTIEEEIFGKYIVDKEKLIEYGFIQEGRKLVYSKDILKGSFNIIVEFENGIKGKIIEKEYNEEFINFRFDTLGEFSSNIKNEFIKVLTDIRDKCADKQLFNYEQTRRINQFIYTKYGVSPEFLWDKLPSYCMYRADKKWFGVIGSIPRNKVDKSTDLVEEVEVLNVKVRKNEIDNLLNKNGYYEAFHMNKRNWVSIILDDTLSDSVIYNLICDSYENVKL